MTPQFGDKSYPGYMIFVVLSDALLGIDLRNDDPEIVGIKTRGWINIPLSYNQVKYVALDACLGIKMASRNWNLLIVPFDKY
jgi:hypothetical protein